MDAREREAILDKIARKHNLLGEITSCENLMRKIDVTAKTIGFWTPNGFDAYLKRGYVERAKDYTVYLHRIIRDDADEELHNHPWPWATSLILAGGYHEHRLDTPDAKQVKLITRSICDYNRFDGVYHKITGVDPLTWTLVIAGKRREEDPDWEFIHPVTRRRTPWREFVAHRSTVQ